MKSKPKFRDLRSPIAKSRDVWFNSENGMKCCEGTAVGIYLRNRLEHAFVSGWNAKEKAMKSKPKLKRKKP